MCGASEPYLARVGAWIADGEEEGKERGEKGGERKREGREESQSPGEKRE